MPFPSYVCVPPPTPLAATLPVLPCPSDLPSSPATVHAGATARPPTVSRSPLTTRAGRHGFCSKLHRRSAIYPCRCPSSSGLLPMSHLHRRHPHLPAVKPQAITTGTPSPMASLFFQIPSMKHFTLIHHKTHPLVVDLRLPPPAACLQHATPHPPSFGTSVRSHRRPPPLVRSQGALPMLIDEVIAVTTTASAFSPVSNEIPIPLRLLLATIKPPCRSQATAIVSPLPNGCRPPVAPIFSEFPAGSSSHLPSSPPSNRTPKPVKEPPPSPPSTASHHRNPSSTSFHRAPPTVSVFSSTRNHAGHPKHHHCQPPHAQPLFFLHLLCSSPSTAMPLRRPSLRPGPPPSSLSFASYAKPRSPHSRVSLFSFVSGDEVITGATSQSPTTVDPHF